MKFLTALLTASLLVTLAFPTALAADCEADPNAIAIADFYVGASNDGLPDGTVWEESNPLAGLQRTSCSDDSGRTIPADTRVL